MATITDTTLRDTYLAGHFDGEGSIYMRKRNSSKRYRLTVSVTSGFRPNLEMYQAAFGGSIYLAGLSVNKQLYQWVLNSIDSCYHFLYTLLPYLREKHNEATVALNYVTERLQYNRRGYSGVPKDRQALDELSYQTYLLLKSYKHPNQPYFSPAPSGVGQGKAVCFS